MSNYDKPRNASLKVTSELEPSMKDISLELNGQSLEYISDIITMLLNEQRKGSVRVDSLRKGFNSILDTYKNTIDWKYKKLAGEISQNILIQNPELLLGTEEYLKKDIEEINGRLSVGIQNCQREIRNFEYLFTYFKSQLISLHNMAIQKIPNFNRQDVLRIDEKEKKKQIRETLQSLTGIAFENSVPLTSKNIQKNHLKIQKLVKSMNLSKILTTNCEKCSFSERILLGNNYESLTPLWVKMVHNQTAVSAEEFHVNGDGKDPILLLIKTENGCVFGGVSPQGFQLTNSYSGSKYAFLFSFKTTSDRDPIIGRVKSEKAGFAIKNNESKYSPGFGFSNRSDLFISFKHLDKSYSNVGTVYCLPEEVVERGDEFSTPETFFTGCSSNWEISNIEAFSLLAN